MKNLIRAWLQQMLGFDRYLFLFSVFTINRLKMGWGEKAFLQFAKMIQPGGTILDIGANVGVMTVLLAQKNPGSEIIAFEPIPPNKKALEKIIKRYRLNNVIVYELALGQDNREVEMLMPMAGSSKMPGLSYVTARASVNEGVPYMTAMRRLDDLHQTLSFPLITAIKVDAENFGYWVLKGGQELLKKQKPLVFCELWNDLNRENCFALMKGLGYSIKIFNGKKLVNYQGEDALEYFFIS